MLRPCVSSLVGIIAFGALDGPTCPERWSQLRGGIPASGDLILRQSARVTCTTSSNEAIELGHVEHVTQHLDRHRTAESSPRITAVRIPEVDLKRR